MKKLHDEFAPNEYIDNFNMNYFGKKASFKDSSFVTDPDIKNATDKPLGTGIEKKLKKSKRKLKWV